MRLISIDTAAGVDDYLYSIMNDCNMKRAELAAFHSTRFLQPHIELWRVHDTMLSAIQQRMPHCIVA